MKIDQMFRSHAATGRPDQTSKDSRPDMAVEGKTDVHAVTGDRVTLTKSAHNLAGLVSSANGMSEASMERIDKLRSTINNGDYEINSPKIAKILMNFEFRL